MKATTSNTTTSNNLVKTAIMSTLPEGATFEQCLLHQAVVSLAIDSNLRAMARLIAKYIEDGAVDLIHTSTKPVLRAAGLKNNKVHGVGYPHADGTMHYFSVSEKKVISSKKVTFKGIKATELPPTITGGIGQGGWMDDFHANWSVRKVHSEGRTVWLVGRKDNRRTCFSIKRFCSDIANVEGIKWDIGMYLDETPEHVMRSLRAGGKGLDPEYFNSNPKNKYLALDFKQILEDYGQNI